VFVGKVTYFTNGRLKNYRQKISPLACGQARNAFITILRIYVYDASNFSYYPIAATCVYKSISLSAHTHKTVDRRVHLYVKCSHVLRSFATDTKNDKYDKYESHRAFKARTAFIVPFRVNFASVYSSTAPRLAGNKEVLRAFFSSVVTAARPTLIIVRVTSFFPFRGTYQIVTSRVVRLVNLTKKSYERSFSRCENVYICM